MKKTVFVIYTNVKIAEEAVLFKTKKYCFNVNVEESGLKVGDLIKSAQYDTSMQVIRVLDEEFKYFNSRTGELSNSVNSTEQWEVKTLNIIEPSSEKEVTGSIVRE